MSSSVASIRSRLDRGLPRALLCRAARAGVLLLGASASSAAAAPSSTAPAPSSAAAAPSSAPLQSSAASPAPSVGPRSLLVPAGERQTALAVELGSDALWAAACARGSCSAREGVRVELPPAARSAAARATLQVLELARGRRVVHVRVPLGELEWEALLGAAVGRPEPLVLFSGPTGLAQGEDGERYGDVVWLRSGDGFARVLLGRVREDLQLCGRATLLEPRLLGDDLVLRPAKVQQLSLEERRNARVLRAERSAAPAAGGNALRAYAASSAVGEPQWLTDGRPETSWAEARGGDGRGEFVLMRPVSGAPLVALEFLVRAPEAPPAAGAAATSGAAPGAGAAPKAAWLAARGLVMRIDWSEDAWRQPGAWYRVALPEPLTVDCVALVLELGYDESPDARVSIAELRGITELGALEPEALVARLATPGEAGAAAVPALVQWGSAGVEAVLGAFGALDALGRSRALDVIETAPCERTASIYAGLLTDPNPDAARRAERRLRACGSAAHGALRAAFERADAPPSGVATAGALAALAPALAVELVGARLAAVSAAERPGYRDALSRAARSPEAKPAIGRLLENRSLGVAAEVEVLRALGDTVTEHDPEATRVFERAALAAKTFEQRYVLLPVAARLAPRSAAAVAFLSSALGDADPELRASAARVAPDLPALRSALITRTRDAAVRVRESSVSRLGELAPEAGAPALVERLATDPWPLVRSAAARALGAASFPSPVVDAALARALEDTAPEVRALSARALGRRGATAQLEAIAGRFLDDKESTEVRAAAATALGELCATRYVDALTTAAQRMLRERPSPDAVQLGSAALSALGRSSPPDLEQRLQPFARAAANNAALAAQLAALRSAGPRCRRSPSSE